MINNAYHVINSFTRIFMKVKIPESWRFWQDSQIPIQIRKAIDTIPNRVGHLGSGSRD